MNTAQRIVKNTLSLIVSGAMAQAVAFLTMVYLARVLGPDAFGKVSFTMAIVAYFSLMTHLGLPLLGTRELSKDRNRSDLLIVNILFLRIALAVINFILLVFFAYWLPKPIEYRQLILLFGIGLFFSSFSMDWVFQALEEMEFIGIGRISAAVIFFILSIIFVQNQKQVLAVPLAQISGLFFATSLLLMLYIRKTHRLHGSIRLAHCKSLILQALPLGVSLILIQAIYNIDTLMLGFLRHESEVGYYNAAYKVITPLILLGSVYFDAVFPVMSKYFETSLESLKKLQGYNAKLMSILSVPMVFISIAAAGRIILSLYGPTYRQSILPFQILAVAVGLIYLNMIYARGMWACNQQNAYIKIVSGQVVVNIGLNLLLIPKSGMVGAAAATVAAEFFGLFFYHNSFNKVISVPLVHSIAKPLAACTLATPFFLFANRINSLFAIVVFSGAYMFFLFLIKGITKDDIKKISSIFTSRQFSNG